MAIYDLSIPRGLKGDLLLSLIAFINGCFLTGSLTYYFSKQWSSMIYGLTSMCLIVSSGFLECTLVYCCFMSFCFWCTSSFCFFKFIEFRDFCSDILEALSLMFYWKFLILSSFSLLAASDFCCSTTAIIWVTSKILMRWTRSRAP